MYYPFEIQCTDIIMCNAAHKWILGCDITIGANSKNVCETTAQMLYICVPIYELGVPIYEIGTPNGQPTNLSGYRTLEFCVLFLNQMNNFGQWSYLCIKS